ncbi:M24 family metallopeptidase, partial [Staphylococcus aureus]|uniref:M24 family metallopeptidase n=1 Tax=Staphylococcus aureus TaxID=1280 RepID=UPI0011A2EA5A
HTRALPHRVPTHKIIEKAHIITLHFPPYYNRYSSHITTTFPIPQPHPKLKQIYQILLQSQIKPINHITPPITPPQPDPISTNYLHSKP